MLVAKFGVGTKVVLVLNFETKRLIEVQRRMLDPGHFEDSIRVKALAEQNTVFCKESIRIRVLKVSKHDFYSGC